MHHDDCTCCRHWRRFEQPSAYEGRPDPAPPKTAAQWLDTEVVGNEPPIALLPPAGAELA